MKKKPELCGLILAGGMSLRMGQDKAFLNYFGKPHYQLLFEELSCCCKNVFLSCRKEQSSQFDGKYPLIFDRHYNIGPMNGLLSFFEKYPSKACLVLACDMPFADENAFHYLIGQRQMEKPATCFSAENGLPEPLFCIWEPKAYETLKVAFREKKYSLRDLLKSSDCRLIQTIDEKWLLNINKPHELQTILEMLRLPPGKS